MTETTDKEMPFVPIRHLEKQDSDSAFIAFASPEERFLGIARLFAGYAPKVACLLQIEDEPNPDRVKNIEDFRTHLVPSTTVYDIPVRHSDVVFGVDALVKAVANACDSSGAVTVDITTFPKASLLFVLRALSRSPAIKHLRILYTEPAAYGNRFRGPTSYGVRRVAVIPTFSALYQPNKDLVLIIFLGYERDRALGMWQSIEPNRTFAVIGKPAYQSSWEGRAESLNAALLAGLDDSAIHYVDPRNPIATFELLRSIIRPESGNLANYYIAPLGTKPQTLGVHYFCSEFPEASTVAYASPLEYASQYISLGVGRSWELSRPRGHK